MSPLPEITNHIENQTHDAVPKDNLELILHTVTHGHGTQFEIAKAGIQLVALLLRKHTDYGCSIFKRPLLAPQIEPAAAIRVRLSDKIERLIQLAGSNKPMVVSESFDDSIRDLAGYSILLEASKHIQ